MVGENIMVWFDGTQPVEDKDCNFCCFSVVGFESLLFWCDDLDDTGLGIRYRMTDLDDTLNCVGLLERCVLLLWVI